MLYLKIKDSLGFRHYVGVEMVAHITEDHPIHEEGAGAIIVLTNGEKIMCEKGVTARDVFQEMADAESYLTIAVSD